MDIYLVGGAVRDKLLGLSIGDRDWVVVGARPQELLEQGFRQVGKDFPVFLHPKTHEEYALARTERKSGSGYTGFEFDTSTEVTLEQDLLRRDLTINAIAQDSNGALIDPFNGRADIDNKVLRHVSDAFVEDPVRVLRVARFAARYHQLGFTLAPATLDLMKTIAASGELDHLVPERVWTETHRALQENSAWAFFETLRACDALNVIFPEVEALYGVPQPAKWHPEIDTGVHTMMVLQQACRLSPSAEVRFAALVHDLGKGNTPKDILPSHYGHERRSVKLVKKLCDRLKAPSRYRELALIVAEYHGKVHRCAELKASTLLKLLKATDAIRRPERFEAFLIACEADARGRTGLEDNPYPQRAFLLEALEKVRSVDYKDVLSQESDGKKIADAIYKRQVSELKRWKSLNSDEHSDDHNSQ